jgi:murein DD-endopeptidase MepM/ murein hydrolase activator NlpD
MKQEGVDVELGDFVEKGGHLGWIGTSGTGFPHLHFQICERSGMCSYPDREFTMPVNFSNAHGELDAAGGLVQGIYYTALPCN